MRAMGRGFVTSKLVWMGVTGMAFSHDGSKLAVAGRGPIKLFDTTTGQLIGDLTGHRKGVVGVAFNADGSLLISGGMDGQVKTWDPSTQKELKSLLHSKNGGTLFSVAMSPNGKLAASASSTLKVWDLESGNALAPSIYLEYSTWRFCQTTS